MLAAAVEWSPAQRPVPRARLVASHTGRMREAFVHTAVLHMIVGADERVPGAAITTALCGDLEHEPPCPVSAHHTASARNGDTVRLRVLFAAEPADEARVRADIDAALVAGEWLGPDGVVTHWRLLDSSPAEIAGSDAERAERLRRDRKV